jgi:branched-chain amino acid transport system substrate-binding protein
MREGRKSEDSMLKITGAVLAAGLSFATQALAADAPAEIKIGTLYASSGRFASISMPVHSALKLWMDQKNADGGVYVKAFDKKIPVKLVAYDDQSNTATASTLYNQLITQDKVDLLVADSGSVLTAPAVAIARDHKMFLFDQTGTGASFFSKDNPYIALMSDPVSTIWPKPVADFVSHDGPGLGIKKIAILYSTNEFTGTQANAFRKFVKDSGAPIEIVYDQGIPTETTNSKCCLRSIQALRPSSWKRTSAKRGLSTFSLTCRPRNCNIRSISAWTSRIIKRPGTRNTPTARSNSASMRLPDIPPGW